jgi:hypothetical protein
MPSMLGMPRMSAGLAGGMPGAPLMGGLYGKVGGKGWETVGVRLESEAKSCELQFLL